MEHESISGKIREYEFDSTRNVVYQISCDGHGNYPFIEYGRGSELIFSNYSSLGLRTFYCKENYKGISEFTSEFDINGNSILSEYTHEGKNFSGHEKRVFEWRKGKMIRSEKLLPEDDETISAFDTKGRCVERSFGNSLFTYDYKEHGDTITTVQTYFRADSVVRVTTISELKQFEGQQVYVSITDHSGKIELEIRVMYDEKGNVIRYYRQDASMGDRFDTLHDNAPSRIEIKNSYDNRGLLVKQEFFNQTDSTKSELIRVYRFFYEETPLRFKFEKGELRRKEIEMNESYGRDY